VFTCVVHQTLGLELERVDRECGARKFKLADLHVERVEAKVKGTQDAWRGNMINDKTIPSFKKVRLSLSLPTTISMYHSIPICDLAMISDTPPRVLKTLQQRVKSKLEWLLDL
jgi:hypothetical protein